MTIQHAYLDPHNFTGDIVEAVADASAAASTSIRTTTRLATERHRERRQHRAVPARRRAGQAGPPWVSPRLTSASIPATLDLTVTLS